MSTTEPPLFGLATTAMTSESRRTNLSLILSLVHHRGALSRSELTRATGLNRSTVATLSGQLVDLGLVYETAPTTTAMIGRPSPEVNPSGAMVALAINPEVDAITIGLVALGGRVLKKVRYETAHIPSVPEVVNVSAAVIDGIRSELHSRYRVVGMGVAVPGLTRAADGIVTYAPHLGWKDEPIARLLQEATGFPVWAANDASLGAVAELLFGAGVGSMDLIYLNGGASGVGGGIVSNGSLRTGAAGFAGEIGHTLVNSDGVVCHCGSIGCLETEVSLGRLQDLVGLRGADIDDVEVALAAGWNDVIATEVNAQLDFLAIALSNVVNIFNPERIVLGGFLATLFQLNPERLTLQVASRALHGPREVATITRAVLGSSLLMIGAAELALAPLLADPAGVRALTTSGLAPKN